MLNKKKYFISKLRINKKIIFKNFEQYLDQIVEKENIKSKIFLSNFFKIKFNFNYILFYSI